MPTRYAQRSMPTPADGPKYGDIWNAPAVGFTPLYWRKIQSIPNYSLHNILTLALPIYLLPAKRVAHGQDPFFLSGGGPFLNLSFLRSSGALLPNITSFFARGNLERAHAHNLKYRGANTAPNSLATEVWNPDYYLWGKILLWILHRSIWGASYPVGCVFKYSPCAKDPLSIQYTHLQGCQWWSKRHWFIWQL